MSAQDEFVMECTICFDGFDVSQIFKTPRILPCGHTFCTECLARLVQADSSLKCPNCNSKIQNINLEAIPRNFNFMEILERRQKPFEEEHPLCQTCESGDHAATQQCVDCEEFTCSAMVKIHTMPKAMRHHRVLPLHEARDFFRKENPFSGDSPLKEASCPQHVGEQLKVYDSTCRKAICSICALLPEHRGEAL
jgi:hypothetical protein